MSSAWNFVQALRYSSSSNNVILVQCHFIVRLTRRKKEMGSWPGPHLSGVPVFSGSPCLCGFLQGLQFPPKSRRRAHQVHWHVSVVPVWMAGPATKWHPVQGGIPPGTLSCRKRLWPSVPLNWNKGVDRKNYLPCSYPSSLNVYIVYSYFRV